MWYPAWTRRFYLGTDLPSSGNRLNIILDIVFVSRFQMGVAGVAYATVHRTGSIRYPLFWKLTANDRYL